MRWGRQRGGSLFLLYRSCKSKFTLNKAACGIFYASVKAHALHRMEHTFKVDYLASMEHEKLTYCCLLSPNPPVAIIRDHAATPHLTAIKHEQTQHATVRF